MDLVNPNRGKVSPRYSMATS
uniref:Uncharacterized protein n=1 Tax=Anguilla anguilla TaxID=7936 RepID=A0A0E9T5V6_ANGAN